eukprot:13853692-Alexandrium_andersonii.AAC.1
MVSHACASHAAGHGDARATGLAARTRPRKHFALSAATAMRRWALGQAARTARRHSRASRASDGR